MCDVWAPVSSLQNAACLTLFCAFLLILVCGVSGQCFCLVFESSSRYGSLTSASHTLITSQQLSYCSWHEGQHRHAWHTDGSFLVGSAHITASADLCRDVSQVCTPLLTALKPCCVTPHSDISEHCCTVALLHNGTSS